MATAPTTQVHEADEHTLPAFLRRVRIRGYKSIGFCDVRLQPRTILVGRNAAGKSNFLDAVAFLRDILIVGVNEASKRHGGYDAIPCRSCPESSVLIEIECGSTISLADLQRMDKLDLDEADLKRQSQLNGQGGGA